MKSRIFSRELGWSLHMGCPRGRTVKWVLLLLLVSAVALCVLISTHKRLRIREHLPPLSIQISGGCDFPASNGRYQMQAPNGHCIRQNILWVARHFLTMMFYWLKLCTAAGYNRAAHTQTAASVLNRHRSPGGRWTFISSMCLEASTVLGHQPTMTYRSTNDMSCQSDTHCRCCVTDLVMWIVFVCLSAKGRIPLF